MAQGLLIKYGEIAIKGNNRKSFENALIHNIKESLGAIGTFSVTKEQGRLLVEGSPLDEAVLRLQKVFGIIGICPVTLFDDHSYANIEREALRYLAEAYGTADPGTFKVEARRADKSYPMTSQEIAVALGDAILQAHPDWKVDVHCPQTVLHVELRTRVYIFSKIIPGPGGMPVTKENRATLLLSGGIDSPVAGYMIAKRGVTLSAVYFHAHPYTSERAKEKVVELARRLSEYAGHVRLYVVPFTDLQLTIYDRCPHDQLTIIMRRCMSLIAQRIADREASIALVTGENLGQVASQTLHSLFVTNEVCRMPVFRPLIGFDKQEIIEMAQKIDTYETSILPYEDCCTIFVAKHPQTKPKLGPIKESETHLTDLEAQVERCVETSEIVELVLGKVKNTSNGDHENGMQPA